jgi:hypothetical protein
MTTSTLPTSRDCLARTNALIESLTDPEHRAMAEVARDHWWAEAIGDVDAAIATLTEDCTYRVNGSPMMLGGETTMSWQGRETTRQIYQSVVDHGINIAGPLVNEHWLFSDWGVGTEADLYMIQPGSMLTLEEPLDPDQLYLTTLPHVTLFPWDREQRKVKGEVIYLGAPYSITPVDKSAVAEMLG